MHGVPDLGTEPGELDEVAVAPSDGGSFGPATDERRRPITGPQEAEDDSAAPLTATDSTPTSLSGSEPAAVGGTLLEEARSLVEARRFADAARVLESLQRLRPDDPEALGLVALAQAHLGRRRKKVRSTLAHLSSEYGNRATTWRTVGDVAMARFQFDPAQHAARTAVQMDPKSVANWHSLAAAYAGNGWFEESQACLAEAAALDPVGEYRDDSQVALGFGHWQIGRAVNFWALTHSYFAVVALFGFVVFGLLGLAVALSAPMLLREIRVRAVPEPFRSLAAVAWRREHRLRFLNATVVAAVLVLWLIVLTITR